MTNSDGEAVADATITPSGMRTRVERSSHRGWSENRHGPRPKVTTDEHGLAEIQCPKFVFEGRELGEVTWLVEHEDYVTFRQDRPVDDDPVRISLENGRLMIISAVNAESDQQVTANLHAVLSGSGGADEWTQLKNGMLISRTVDRKRGLLRVVHIPEKGSTTFSEILDLFEYGVKRRVRLKDVRLHMGVRLEGMIDAQVPRPIQNGTVSLWTMPREESDDDENKITWTDWATINADGSFIFESLPRGDIGQMIAACDGWVCDVPTAKELKAVGLSPDISQWLGSRVVPQVAELDSDVLATTIRMQRTASCRVTVVDPDGHPLAGVSVDMWPNQVWLNRGSQRVGAGSSSRAYLSLTDEQRRLTQSQNGHRKIIEFGVRSPDVNRYSANTDTDGVAVIHTLPGGDDDIPRSESILLSHDDYDHPIDGIGGLRRETSVALRRGEMTEVTIRMEKKGTTSIDD